MIHRIDVRTLLPAREGTDAAIDPVGESIRQQIMEFGPDVGPITTRRIFLIDSDASESDVRRIAIELLADPIVEEAQIVARGQKTAGSRILIHLKPGVTDPVAA